MRFTEFITEQEQTASDVNQLITDIKKGEIAPTVLQAISSYIKKKISTQQEPEQGKIQQTQAPAQPAQPAQPQQPSQPQISAGQQSMQ
jgi:hypothetical protein